MSNAESDQHTDLVIGGDGLARPSWAATDPLLRDYYDREWGVPVTDESGLYEAIVLEGFQAGLSWSTVLRKRSAFRSAFENFDPDVVSRYTEFEIERLMRDQGIIRNYRKICGAVTNARATVRLRESGGLSDLVWSFRPESTPSPSRLDEIPTESPESAALSKALRKNGFVFIGPTTMYAMLQAIGVIDTHLVGSHRRGTSGVWHDG